jgi:uncharacterized protein (DUF58 family)
MPTRRGLALIVAGIALVVSGRYLALVEMGTLGLVVLSIVLAMTISVFIQRLRARNLAKLTITRTHPPAYVFAHHPFPVTLHSKARQARLPLCTVTEIATGEAATPGPVGHGSRTPARAVGTITAGLCRTGDLQYRQSFPRGLHRLGPGEVTVVDSLGLARLSLLKIAPTVVTVWPSALDLGPDVVNRLFAESRTGVENEPGDLRRYVPGDDLRRVHWATSARTNQLMVRGVDQVTRSHEARRIVVDVCASSYRAQSFELALSVAGSLLMSASPDERIDLILDGPSGLLVYPTIGQAMSALAAAVPDRRPATADVDSLLDWKAGIVIAGENTPIPAHAHGPIIVCAATPAHDDDTPGRIVIHVTSLDTLEQSLTDGRLHDAPKLRAGIRR